MNSSLLWCKEDLSIIKSAPKVSTHLTSQSLASCFSLLTITLTTVNLSNQILTFSKFSFPLQFFFTLTSSKLSHPIYVIIPHTSNPTMNALWNLTQCCAPIGSQKKTKKKCKYIQPPRRKSCRPVQTYTPPEGKLDDRTVYNLSFMSLNSERDNGYDGCNAGYCVQDTPLCPNMYPNNPQMCNNPPMCPNIPQICPNTPQMCPCMNYLPCSFHPDPSGDDGWNPNFQTVQQLSYQPCKVRQDEKSWKKKAMYAPPKFKMEDTTVHKLSYAPPGEFVECTDDESDSVDCPYWQYPPMPPCEGPANPWCCQPCLYEGNNNVNVMYNY